ncbi:hypothetical protein GG804_24950 [Sphingomonas histidinilytica]|uniref:hypothetical protein n=1 Tax=Rhizorhabdus histidinilytica TaxID=439228 RepID=UPI001ADA02BB|nr:hypothetical protein [Rhizorhabdus histidinilytica]MBO9380020.1 hypothetical protein [Rhizorhabdus histidinilytica]
MTLVDINTVRPALTTPIGMTPLKADDAEQTAGPAPSIGDTALAALRTQNTIGSWLSERYDMSGATNQVEPGYNAWNEIAGTKYEGYWDSFVESNNRGYTARIKQQIDREDDDRRTLAAAGWQGTVAAMMAGVLDPTILIPIGGEIIAGGKGIWTIGKGAVTGARAAATGTAIQEGLLQSTQETRTAEESATAIGSSVVLGGVLGGGAAALLSRPEQLAASQALERLSVTTRPGSIGAAAVGRASIQDLTVAGGAEALASMTRAISPNLRANFRMSPAARQYSQELAENTLYQQMHDEGRTLGAAVETQARSAANGRMAEALRSHNDIFAAAKKSGLDMTRTDFEEAVGRAMRRDDQDPNPIVAQAAQAWREKMFDTFKEQAIEAGLLPDDVDVSTAASYFSRVWNREHLTAREAEFKDIVTSYYGQQLSGDFADSLATHQSRIAALDQELADLHLSPDDRATTLSSLDTQIKDLETGSPIAAEQAARISELRQVALRARETGDKAGEKAARDQIAAVRTEGGADLAAFTKSRGELRARSRRVDLNYAGLQDRADAIETSIADIAEAGAKSAERLISRGRALEREAQRLDPDKLRQKVSDLRTSFYQLIERSNRAQDRTAKAIEDMRQHGGPEVVGRLEKLAAAEATRNERLNRISQRLEAAEALDPHAKLSDIRASIDEMVEAVSQNLMTRGEKTQRLRDRLARMDPQRLNERVKAIGALKADLERQFLDRWEIGRLGAGVDLSGAGRPDFTTAARQIADEVFDTLTGRGVTGSGSSLPEYITPITRGPLKERTFNIPDRLVESFLESNVVEVARRYSRTIASEIELTKRFGRADMRDQIQRIRDEYRELREQISAQGGAEAEIAKKMKAIAADEKGAIEDLEAMRDLVRGTYRSADNASNYGRLVRSLQAFNYIRNMGGVVISSLADLYRPAMVHGLGRYLSQGIAPLLTNLSAIKLSVKEAKLAGQVTESVLQHRMMSLGQIGDPYAGGTAVERWLDNGSRLASKWNGLSLWTDSMKAISSVLSQNRLIESVVAGKDRRLLAYLGIDGDMSQRIASQFAEHGETLQGVKVANTQNWTDAEAVQAYRSAVSKDVDSIIVTPSVGDIPLFARTPTGKLMLQFKNFMFAAHQRVTLRAMQEGRTQFLSGLIGMTTLGIMTSTLRSWRGGQDRWERFKEAASNPGYLIGEGLDSSGMFALPIEIANTGEKLTTSAGIQPFNLVKKPLLMAGEAINPRASMQGESTRFVSRGPWGALLGPSVGLVEDGLATSGAMVDAAKGDELSKRQKRAASGMVPFASYIGMREAMQVLLGDSPYAD